MNLKRLGLLVGLVGCSNDALTEGGAEISPQEIAPSALTMGVSAVETRELDYRANGTTIELLVGTDLTIELAAPRGVTAGKRYEWTVPKVGGALTHLATETRVAVDRRYWTYRFRVADRSAGKLRIDRYYPLGSSDPAPDFGLRVQVTNSSKSE